MGREDSVPERQVIATPHHARIAEYRKRAEDCRNQVAKLATQPHHWEAFLEMAQTWEQLADLHELSERLKASGVLLKKPAISAE
jgi:sirohydrochlorin ferrochelatase